MRSNLDLKLENNKEMQTKIEDKYAYLKLSNVFFNVGSLFL